MDGLVSASLKQFGLPDQGLARTLGNQGFLPLHGIKAVDRGQRRNVAFLASHNALPFPFLLPNYLI